MHAGSLLKRQLRLHRVTENRRPSGTIRGINRKTAKRTHETGTAMETTGVAMSLTMTMRLQRKDNLARLINTSSTGEGYMKNSSVFRQSLRRAIHLGDG
jgi:hypothetical protein